MKIVTISLISLIALLHLFIMWFEMFQWSSMGPQVFTSLPPEIFPSTKSMAANQGLYNGFLATGLIWSLLITEHKWQQKIATCFLIFVAIAGIYGAYTISPKILIIQTLPALTALGTLWLRK